MLCNKSFENVIKSTEGLTERKSFDSRLLEKKIRNPFKICLNFSEKKDFIFISKWIGVMVSRVE